MRFFLRIRLRTEWSEQVINSFIDAYWPHVRKRTTAFIVYLKSLRFKWTRCQQILTASCEHMAEILSAVFFQSRAGIAWTA